ncbi:MAG: NAD(P)/FAD-dependent oxidoreductase [Chloroflexi bacterium]|nr:NAD(P)/FAD-dependent oxidoreductase [Chloroflexota bacterium]
MSGNKQRLVVIGNGMAAGRLIEELLDGNGAEIFDIVVFGEESSGNYNRALLPEVLAGIKHPEDIVSHQLPWYEQNRITLHAGVRAGWIDRVAKKVYAPGGVVEPWTKLVIATGSASFMPAIEGMTSEEGSLRDGIFLFRSLGDCEAIIKYLAPGRKVAVIGGGLLGLEAAGALLNRGLEVHVVHQAAYLLETMLDELGGTMLKQTLEKIGLHIHVQKMTRSVLGNGSISGLAFQDGSALECDLVIIATGGVPNVNLAKQAGLSVQRGVLVNDDLSCRNDPDIYAIGECAQHRGRVYAMIAPVWEQAKVLARRLMDDEQIAYHGSNISTKLKIAGVELAVMGGGESRAEDEIVRYVEPLRCIYKKLIVREGRLTGAILLGDSRAAPRVLQVFRGEAKLPEERAEILFPLSGDSPAADTADMPDTAQVCNCNGVSKGAIIAAVKKGAVTIRAVGEATRAGTGCGSCKSQVQAILELDTNGLPEDHSAHYYVPVIPLTKAELAGAVKESNLRSVSAVFAALAGGSEDAPSKVALAQLLKSIWGNQYEDERDARFINDRVHANIQNDGTFSVVPRIYGGVVSASQLRRIADVTEKYDIPMVKLTGGQRMALLGISKEKLPEVWKELEMPSGYAYTKAFRTCKTCVGTDFCRYGLGDSIDLGRKIEKRFQGLESPHKLKLAVSGCPRNCAEATTKDLGAIAIDGGKWQVYIGGAAGARVRKGDLLCGVDSHDEVLRYMGRFIQYYREHGEYQERTYHFVERIGTEKLRQLLIEDAGGICQQLDREVEAAANTYVDPWQEGQQPVHPAQFVSLVGTL